LNGPAETIAAAARNPTQLYIAMPANSRSYPVSVGCAPGANCSGRDPRSLPISRLAAFCRSRTNHSHPSRCRHAGRSEMGAFGLYY